MKTLTFVTIRSRFKSNYSVNGKLRVNVDELAQQLS